MQSFISTIQLLLVAVLLASSSYTLQAQLSTRKPLSNGISNKKSYTTKESYSNGFTVRGGLTQFFGELNDPDMQTFAGVGYRRSLNRKWSVLFDYSAGKLGGQKDAFFNSYFVNEYNTAEILAKWDLTAQFSAYEPGQIHVYLYGGIGLLYFSANAFDIDSNALLRFTNSKRSARNPLFLRWGTPQGPVGIKKTREGILPAGTAFDYKISERWKLGVDYRFYLVRSDKVDATSGRRLINPEEATSYSDTPNDKFSFLSFFLTYCFPDLSN